MNRILKNKILDRNASMAYFILLIPWDTIYFNKKREAHASSFIFLKYSCMVFSYPLSDGM